MTFVVDLELAIGQIPYFHGAIPAAWHNNWVAVIRRETHARNPVRVAFILDGVLAFGKCVPQLNCFVPWSRHNLTVIRAERNWQHILHDAKKERKVLVKLLRSLANIVDFMVFKTIFRLELSSFCSLFYRTKQVHLTKRIMLLNTFATKQNLRISFTFTI